MVSGLYSGGEFLVPWRNVSGQQEDGTITYYKILPRKSCRSCVSSISQELTRCVLTSPEDHATPPGIPLIGGKVLVIANPASGKGKSSNTVTALRDTLAEAGLETIVHYTERSQHAIQIVSDYGKDLSDFMAICSVGGDGTVHEVLNGMKQVADTGVDWGEIPPLAVVPTGSGNAIANSTGIISAHHAALNIIHSLRSENAKPLAIMQFQALNGPKSGKLLIGGLQWGLLADVDQGTENLRWMGDIRFDLGAVMAIIKNKFKRTRVKVTVDPVQHAAVNKMIESGKKKKQPEKAQIMNTLEDIGGNTFLVDSSCVLCLAWNSSVVADGVMITPYAKVTELGVFDFVLLRAGISRAEMVQLFLNVADGSLLKMTDALHYFKATKVVFESLEGRALTIDGEAVPVEPCVLEMAPEDGKVRILDSFSDTVEFEP